MSDTTWVPDREQQGEVERPGIVRSGLRAMSSALMGRMELANWSGFQFGLKRNLFEALGYPRVLTPSMYRWRYQRDGLFARIMEAYPISTWRGGGTIIEDEDPDTQTEFEKAWIDLDKRLNIWQTFEKADILGQLGRFSIIILGAPGNIAEPLQNCPPAQLVYLKALSERDARPESLDTDTKSPRFGQPVYYTISRLTAPLENTAAMVGRVHWTRVIHIADRMLDDNIFGQPQGERGWNLFDDLLKVVGGGSEAFWKRVDAGMQLKLDPNVADMKPEDKTKLDEQLDEYVHGLRRVLRTRGIDIETMTSAVAGIKDPVMTIVSLLSATYGIPQRILLGSERGELASDQDRDNWSERIQDRRLSFASPVVIRAFIDRLIALKTLPTPQNYEARWPTAETLDDAGRAELAKTIAEINQAAGETVVTIDEIRDRYLGLPPLAEVLSPEEANALETAPETGVPVAAARRRLLRTETRVNKWRHLTLAEKCAYIARRRILASKKRKGEPWQRTHRAADRFRHAG